MVVFKSNGLLGGPSLAAMIVFTAGLMLVGGCPTAPSCTTDTACDDSNLCTTDTCNLATGQCVHTPEDCDDADACTTDSCDTATGTCANEPKQCPEGQFCNPADGACAAPGNGGVTGKFVGAEACAACHADKHENWAATLHAEALEALESIGMAEGECLGCHTVGYGQEGGFVDRLTTNALAGVQCENCHGPGADHVADISDVSKRPTVSIAADVCGACHTDVHHPTYEQWQESAHAQINADVAADLLAGGTFVNTCGICHSGDVFYESGVEGQTVAEDRFAGLTAEDLNPITCVACHSPHRRTNNAAAPDEGRDFQLRFAQVVSPEPSNSVDVLTDPTRYNLCGHCHHSRGRTWETTTRPPHRSVQSNVFIGEMDTPEGEEPLVANMPSGHADVPEQCSTCHLFRKDFESEEAPAISGHTFTIDFEACIACHSTGAEAMLDALQAEVQAGLDDILARLGDPATWEYSAEGGPPEFDEATPDVTPTQNDVSDVIKQVRFLYSYVVADGSLGPHNPDYIRAILAKADELLTAQGM